jgi:hypothetical protein
LPTIQAGCRALSVPRGPALQDVASRRAKMGESFVVIFALPALDEETIDLPIPMPQAAQVEE